MLKNRTDLINYIINRYNLKSYLELGVQHRVNFDKIKCQYKLGVDPEAKGKDIFTMTSDEFFEQDLSELIGCDLGEVVKFGIIFIDGMHTAEQVKKDFESALFHLEDNGFIVLHDCLPDREEYTHVPRATKIWYGDVYKFAMTLPSYEGIDFITWKEDCGCCIIWKDPAKKAYNVDVLPTWTGYEILGLEVLRVTLTENLHKRLP